MSMIDNIIKASVLKFDYQRHITEIYSNAELILYPCSHRTAL